MRGDDGDGSRWCMWAQKEVMNGYTDSSCVPCAQGTGTPAPELNGLAKPLLREAGASTDTCSSAWKSSMDARLDAAESKTEGTYCSNCSVDLAWDTLWGLGG